jgi:hypothetical protein
MRRAGGVLLLALVLAAGIHADWHLARPHHHRWSLEWREHWIFAIALFAAVGCAVAHAWPRTRWRDGAWTLFLGVFLAQGVEPVLELATYRHVLGYPDEPDRLAVFLLCIAVGIPAFAATLWLSAPRTPPEGAAALPG